jgi:hypothetical protein
VAVWLRRTAGAWAGPVLILGFTLFAFRGFAFHDRLTNEHPDLLAFWLPRWTFLGRSIAAGHVPVWNPFEMAGYRFAADPQSGWLALLPSWLFADFSPGVAMRAILVLQPVIAGLGLYAFLRVDGLGRVAASVGGVSLVGMIVTSEIAIAMPFAGALAWTTLTLLGAAGFVRADRWSRRIAWLALGAFAWSQVATAHLSHGLAIATLLVIAYLVASVWRRGIRASGRAALFLVALPLCALAVLVPRLQFVGASSLSAGYESLGPASTSMSAPRDEQAPVAPGGVWAGWPLAFAAAPGAYAGAAALVLVPLALRARRRRRLAASFGAALALTYVLLLPAVLGASWVRDLILRLPYGDVILHNPARLRYVAVLAIPVLAAAGLQGLVDDPISIVRALLWLGAGLALWLGLPLLAGAAPERWALFAVAIVPAGIGLLAAARRPAWGAAVVGVLAVELVASAVLAGRVTGDELRTGLEGSSGIPLPFQPLRSPDVDLAAFLAPSPFAATIGSDRYMTWAPPAAAYEKGYLFAQEPADWPALANERGTLFGLRDALGYNPVQLPRYWSWMRRADPLPMYYNTAVLARPTSTQLDVLGVQWLVVPHGVPPTVRGRVVATAEGYDLVRVAGAPPLVSAPTNVVVTHSKTAAIVAGLRARNDPSSTVVTEERPGIVSGGLPSPVSFTGWDGSTLTITGTFQADAIVVVRVAFDDGWDVKIDGDPTKALPADGLFVGVPVHDGTHTVELSYHDSAMALGARMSALVWYVLLVVFVAALVWERRNREIEPVTDPALTSTPDDAAPLR